MTKLKKSTGFSLIEMMIVVAIVAVLASIAYPSYVSQIERGRRAECKSGLLQAMQQQERNFTQFNEYKNFLSGAGGSAIKSFSGDSATKSSCLIAADDCTVGGAPTVGKQVCVELIGSFVQADSVITSVYLDSNGNKRCKIGGSVVTDSRCW